jgi:hypothetical protein
MNLQTNSLLQDAIQSINKNNLIKLFLEEIDKCGCVYSNRWGDLPIWGLILSTLINEEYYEEIKKISYYHGSWNKHIN